MVFFGFLHTSKAFLSQTDSQTESQSGLGIGLVLFGSGLRTPKRFRLNRFSLDKVKLVKPKPNRCRFLHLRINSMTLCVCNVLLICEYVCIKVESSRFKQRDDKGTKSN